MSLFSTTQPPYTTKFFVDPRSTTQPPSQTQSMLVVISMGHGFAGLMRKGLKALRGETKLPAPGAGGKKPPAHEHSPDVVGLLAAEELLEAVSVPSVAAWDSKNGIPRSKVLMSFTGSDGKPVASEHAVSGQATAGYKTSVKDVKDAMKESRDDDLISFEASSPTLRLALAVGMDRGAGTTAYPYRYTALLIDVIVEVVTAPTHRLKGLLQVPRPNSADAWKPDHVPTPAFDPVPGYTAYPSGHATVCAAAAVVLNTVAKSAISGLSQPLMKVAEEIGKNRERAGLHTKLDTDEGLALGKTMGQWMVDAATIHSKVFTNWADLFEAAQAEW